MHGGIGNECRVNLHHIDSEEIEKRGAAALLAEHGRHPGGARLRQPRHRGEDRRRSLRAREGRPLLRHLPRPADGGHRVRAQRGRPARARTRPSSSPSRRTRSSTSCPSSATSPTRARPCGSAPIPACWRPGLEGRGGLRRRRDLRAPPPPLRGQQRLPRGARPATACVISGRLARPAAGRDDRAAAAPVLRRLPVPPRVQVAPAGAAPAVPVVHRRPPCAPVWATAVAAQADAGAPPRLAVDKSAVVTGRYGVDAHAGRGCVRQSVCNSCTTIAH